MHTIDTADHYYLDGFGPLTWQQLLYRCYRSARNVHTRYNSRTGRHEELPDQARSACEAIAAYCAGFRHNPHDGVWSNGYYQRLLERRYIDEQGNHVNVYRNGDWVAPCFTPHPHVVWDSRGRIINSADLRQALLAYIPDSAHAVADRRRRRHGRHYSRHNDGYVHRSGPVVGIHCYRNREWHQMRGDHGHTIQELRQLHRDRLLARELKEELGLTLKFGRSAGELDPYNHGHHVGSHGKGWKRSRKEKQWMKHGWRKCYPAAGEITASDPDA